MNICADTEPIYVTKPYLPKQEEFQPYLDSIWQSSWLTNQGPLHQQLEERLASYLASENLTLYTNGHLALEAALMQYGFAEASEVITTPFTFISTANAIVLNRLKPVFCDIKPSDLTIDENKIEALITDKTVAIMPVHVYGHPCNVEAIQQIADRHGLRVIYDAAHAFGVKINGVSLARFGDFSMYSFHATKLFHSIEGGALAYRSAGCKQALDAEKNFGITGEESAPYMGRNAKMNEFQAAMGLANLDVIDTLIQRRRDISLMYRTQLDAIPGIQCFALPEAVEYNYAYFPVLIGDAYGLTRDEVYTLLKQHNIYSRKYFHPIIPQYELYRHQYRPDEIPVAVWAGERILTLPLYHDLAPQDVARVCSVLKNKGRANG